MIIERLARGSARISEGAEQFSMSLTGFCKHVRVLERAGLVRRTRQGRGNTLELSPEPLRDVTVARTIPASAEKVSDVWIDPTSHGGPWFGAGARDLYPV